MASTTILAAGNTERSSTTISIAATETANFAIFTDNAAGIPANAGAAVYLDTPAQDTLLATMTAKDPSVSIPGPADVIIKIPASAVNIGVVRYT